jgi:hypothetical protein
MRKACIVAGLLLLCGIAVLAQQYAFGPTTVNGVPIVNGTPTGVVSGTALIAVGQTSVSISDTSVTGTSKFQVTEDRSIEGDCNTQSTVLFGYPYVTAKTPGVGFTIKIEGIPTGQPICLDYSIFN